MTASPPESLIFAVAGPSVLTTLQSYLRHVGDTQVSIEQADESFRKFAERRLFIRTKQDKIAALKLNGVQRRVEAVKRLLRMQGKPPRLLILKYRQGGITTYEQAKSYKHAVTIPNSRCITIAHTRESTARIFRISHLMHQQDPQAPAIKGVGNKYQLDFPALNSLFFVSTAGGTGVGRGETFSRVHWSEVSKSCVGPKQIEDQEDLLAGLTEGAANGEVVLETTAHGAELFCQKYREAKMGQNEWTPVFLPWFFDEQNDHFNLAAERLQEIQDTITDRETDLIVRHKLTLSQISWRRQKIRELGRLFRQEYPEDDESAFLTGGSCYFDPDRIIELLEACPDYERKHIAGGYEIEWEKPKRDIQYVAGCDSSEGRPGCDPNGTGILRKDTGAQVAAIHGLFEPGALAELSVKLCRKYNDALLGVEVQNHGYAVIQRVKALGYRKAQRQLFHRKFIRRKGWRDAGWSTDSKTRPLMLEDLAEAVENESMIVRDRDFLSECLSFKLQAPNRWEADVGAHDDTVIKWGIAWQMRKVRRKIKKLRTIRIAR